jgi:predicted nucleotidyltransferase
MLAMIPEIEQHRDEIIAICEEYGLARLELFGSAATGEFDPERSDVDFLIEYPEGFDYGDWGSRVTEIQDRLQDILGRDVDLVALRWVVNPYLKRSIEETRLPIYAP